VTAVLSNFLCDAGRANPSGLLPALNKVITDHVSYLSEYATANPASRIVIVPPLPRVDPDWFGAYLPGLTSLLTSEVLALSSPQIKCLSPFIAPVSYFDSDNVHLNAAAGVEFVKYIVAGVDQVFPVLDCTGSANAPSSLPTASPDLASAVRDLTSVTERFQADVLTRRQQDNLVFARLKEDRDFELNKSRENRFTISGLKLRGDQVPPRAPAERTEFFRALLQKLVDEACPDLDPKPEVKDVYVNMRHGLGVPFIEGRMDSVSSSSAFRIAGSKLAKAESPNFKGLFIANAVTLTTRVRIEILRALSTALTFGDQEAFVKGFSSRPVLCIKAKSLEAPPGVEEPSSDPGRNYTFCEAVEKWGHTLSQGSLVKAYRKAKPAFNGCLEQYFVVLREIQSDEPEDIFSMLSFPNSNPVGHGYGQSGSSSSSRRGFGSFRSGHRGNRGQQRARPAGRFVGAASKRPLTGIDVDVADSPSKVRK
jgi:hypothetical protein